MWNSHRDHGRSRGHVHGCLQKPVHLHIYAWKYEQGCLRKHVHGRLCECVHGRHMHGRFLKRVHVHYTDSTGMHGSICPYISTKGTGVHVVTSRDKSKLKTGAHGRINVYDKYIR